MTFLDMTHDITPGFSYDKYPQAYGCDITKGYFPYEYMDGLDKLDDTALPPKEAFFSRLKDEGVSDEDYASFNEYGEEARPCRSIVGYDANAVYLWSLMQDMQTGWYTRRREEIEFRPESEQLQGHVVEWLTWEAERVVFYPTPAQRSRDEGRYISVGRMVQRNADGI